MKKSFLLLILSWVIVSCTRIQPPSHRNNQITKVCFASGSCMSFCPQFAISVDSNLDFYLNGTAYCDSAHMGVFVGKISQEFWDTLNIKLEQTNYPNLDSSYGISEDDLLLEMIVYTRNKRKYIVGTINDMPKRLANLCEWLMVSYKNVKLTKIFETKVQRPLPPPPLLEHLRVTPPKTNH